MERGTKLSEAGYGVIEDPVGLTQGPARLDGAEFEAVSGYAIQSAWGEAEARVGGQSGGRGGFDIKRPMRSFSSHSSICFKCD